MERKLKLSHDVSRDVGLRCVDVLVNVSGSWFDMDGTCQVRRFDFLRCIRNGYHGLASAVIEDTCL